MSYPAVKVAAILLVLQAIFLSSGLIAPAKPLVFEFANARNFAVIF